MLIVIAYADLRILNLSMPAPALYGFVACARSQITYASKPLDPTASPPRHGSNVLIRAPLLGVRTASDLCSRDPLFESTNSRLQFVVFSGLPILVDTLCYSGAGGASVALRWRVKYHFLPSQYCRARVLLDASVCHSWNTIVLENTVN